MKAVQYDGVNTRDFFLLVLHIQAYKEGLDRDVRGIPKKVSQKLNYLERFFFVVKRKFLNVTQQILPLKLA